MSRLFAVLLLSPLLGLADEGMWLPDRFPKEAVAKRHGFLASDEFLAHLRLSAVRLSSGGTGSFVSPEGLIFTNHHVAADCIHKVSTAQQDYMKDGFKAASREAERACPDLEAVVLVQIDDVTARVTQGVTPQMPAAEANRARRANIGAIEKACQADGKRQCEVVTLFSGGLYHLYQYKKYDDIRLVFAPEFGIAFFGGDPDNFEYPRYCYDITFLRAYENGKPARVEHYFKWAAAPVKEGDLIFTVGNPGTTGRLASYAELEFSRDYGYPLVYRLLTSTMNAIEKYAAQSPENKRVSQEVYFSLSNSFKAYSGFLSGLRDPRLMARKKEEETALKAAMARDPARREEYARLWDDLASAFGGYPSFFKKSALYERNPARGSALFAIARDVLRYAEETQKPNSERLREYTEAALPSLESTMFSPAPLTPSFEAVIIENYFKLLASELGANDPVLRKLLNGRTPAAAAAYYVNGSRLISVDERKRLAKDVAAMRASNDTMLEMARILDPEARAARKMQEDRIEAVVTSSATKIAQARFAISGGNDYPDATFTLRYAFGPVRGYADARGRKVPYATNIGGLFQRATGKDPYIVPESWLKAKSKLNLSAPMNFVATADTHGGNSGSATLNTKGEIVGILFDGNIESLPRRFLYLDDRARSVHVDAQGILEGLRNVYGATAVLSELESARR